VLVASAEGGRGTGPARARRRLVLASTSPYRRELLARLGVPAGFDPAPLRETVLAQRQRLPWLPLDGFGEPEAAVLLLLERAGVDSPAGLGAVARHRILIGALLLAALAVTAVLRAPASTEGES